MVSSTKSHTARNEKGQTFTGVVFLLKESFIAIDPQYSADAKRVDYLGSRRLPSLGIEKAQGTSESLGEFFAIGGVGIEIEFDRTRGGELLDD